VEVDPKTEGGPTADTADTIVLIHGLDDPTELGALEGPVRGQGYKVLTPAWLPRSLSV
jgi:hypothetical protein